MLQPALVLRAQLLLMCLLYLSVYCFYCSLRLSLILSRILSHTILGRLVMLLPDTFDPQNPRGTRWNYISVTLTALTSELRLPTQTPSPPNTDSPQVALNGMSSRRGLMDTESAHSLLLHCRGNLATLKGFIKGAFHFIHLH